MLLFNRSAWNRSALASDRWIRSEGARSASLATFGVPRGDWCHRGPRTDRSLKLWPEPLGFKLEFGGFR